MLGCDGLGLDIASTHTNGAARRPEDTCNGSERSGFAGSVGTHESDDLARFDGKSQIADCGEIGIAFGELFDVNNGIGFVHLDAVIGQYDGCCAGCQGFGFLLLVKVGQVRGRTVTLEEYPLTPALSPSDGEREQIANMLPPSFELLADLDHVIEEC